jgi:hypothetical protein
MSEERVRRSRRWLWVGVGVLTLISMAAVLLLVGLFWFLREPTPASPAAALAAPTQAVPQPVPLGQFITTPTHNWGDVPYGEVVCQNVPFRCEGSDRRVSERAGGETPGG